MLFVRKCLSFVMLLQVGVPAVVRSTIMGVMHPQISLILTSAINDRGVFKAVANDDRPFGCRQFGQLCTIACFLDVLQQK